MWLWGVICVFILLTIRWTVKWPQSRNGIYSRKGPFYPLKFCAFYLLVSLRKFSAARSPTSGEAGRGKKSYADPRQMERAQPFSDDAKAFDAVFFSGSDQDGNFLVAAMERKKNKKCNSVLYLRLAGKGLFRGPWLPDTSVAADKDDAWESQGLKFHPVEPLRRWSIKFEGKVNKVSDQTESMQVQIDGDWSSDHGIFDYDTDMSASATARVFAKEPWNKQYFSDLQKAHQTHYEQLGDLRLRIQIENDSEPSVMHFQTFRDHSYGAKRDWKLMHRYVFHHVFLANRWKAVVGVVCQPHTCTTLECGFVCLPNGSIWPVDHCSLELANHGEGGDPPQQYGFVFSAGGQEYQMQVHIQERVAHFYGEEQECRIMECFAQYQVNGISGSGICEWQNRNVKSMMAS
ncbi:hypothetical protein TCAL_16245 [Tigriopus californicus]|uniref:Uncharacterized protein n=1 Tax=Tigriopus californicus TaxID=6832 RepID=A0A553N9H0_TIGCA|nr:uncharacterized protein LOC131885016 [Tigriopus californicus]TRY62049.1 hypothetical protein TCAL_16245 [Tigriopus californicus]